MVLARHRPQVYKHGQFWFWACQCSRLGYSRSWNRAITHAHRHVEERL